MNFPQFVLNFQINHNKTVKSRLNKQEREFLHNFYGVNILFWGGPVLCYATTDLWLKNSSTQTLHNVIVMSLYDSISNTKYYLCDLNWIYLTQAGWFYIILFQSSDSAASYSVLFSCNCLVFPQFVSVSPEYNIPASFTHEASYLSHRSG